MEHARTIEGPIDQEFRSEGLIPNEDVTEDIASNVIDNLESRIRENADRLWDEIGGSLPNVDETAQTNVGGISLYEQEVREIAGVVNPKGPSALKIGSLEIVADQYHLKALREPDPVKESLYKSVESKVIHSI